MFKPTSFYPAILRENRPSLFTDNYPSAHKAKETAENLRGTSFLKCGEIAGFAFFDKNNEIIYKFNTLEEAEETVQKTIKALKGGATRKYALLKSSKKTLVWSFNILNKPDLIKELDNQKTFKSLLSLLSNAGY